MSYHVTLFRIVTYRVSSTIRLENTLGTHWQTLGTSIFNDVVKLISIKHRLITIFIHVPKFEIVVFETSQHSALIRHIYITIPIVYGTCNTHASRRL